LGFKVGALRVSFNAGVDMGIEGDEESIGLILIKDFDSLGILFMIEEIDIFFDQFHGSLIDSAVKGDGSVAVDFSSGPGTEEVGEISGSGPQEVEVPSVTIPRRFFGGAMDGSMIGLITPLFEPFVEVSQREGGNKLYAKGFEISLDFSLPFGTIRGAVDEGDPQRGGGVSELVRAEGGAIVEIDLSGQPPFAQSLDQAVGEVFEVFL
jgi:hypothetical protein